MEGKIIAERYRLGSRVGEGGLATVYRATDLRLDRTVAVKILKLQWAADPEILTRFRREARSAAKLSHPHIIQVFDTGADGDIHYLVMEYLPEPNLKQIISEYAPLPSRKVLQVATQVCQALAHIHRQGLVHGDVKPQNILFTDEGLTKLSDFGIAVAADSGGDSISDMVLGTAHYISPEQAQGKPIGPQADLYSLGCMIYEAFTGQVPFSGETAGQVAAKHVRLQPPSPRAINSNISTSEEYLINKAMAKDPLRRYRSAEEMAIDLEKLASGEELDRTGVLSLEDQATTPLRPTPQAGEPAATPPSSDSSRGRQAKADTITMWSTIAVIVLALAVLILLGWLITKAFYPGAPPAEVQVPAVRGLTEMEARQKLTDAKLQIGEISTERDATKPVGQVIDQYPPPGESVPVDARVRLTINLGKEIITVPDVSGKSMRQVIAKLEQVGLSVGDVTEKFSDELAENEIIRQAIAAGTQVEEGTPVDLVVSKGPEPQQPAQPTESTESVEEKPEGDEEPVTVEPDVSISVDEATRSAEGLERTYIVNITVLGQKQQQKIRVMKRDDSGGPIIELDKVMHPSEAKAIRFTGRGNTTIEVYHNDKLIRQQTFSIETLSNNNRP